MTVLRIVGCRTSPATGHLLVEADVENGPQVSTPVGVLVLDRIEVAYVDGLPVLVIVAGAAVVPGGDSRLRGGWTWHRAANLPPEVAALVGAACRAGGGGRRHRCPARTRMPDTERRPEVTNPVRVVGGP